MLVGMQVQGGKSVDPLELRRLHEEEEHIANNTLMKDNRSAHVMLDNKVQGTYRAR